MKNRFMKLIPFILLPMLAGCPPTPEPDKTNTVISNSLPLLVANSEEFSSGIIDDDPASPVTERDITGATSSLAGSGLTFSAGISAPGVAVWEITDSTGSIAPLPTSSVSITPSDFKIINNTEPIVGGYKGFALANCTEYAAERRDQLAQFIPTALPALKNTDIHKYSVPPSGAAKNWLAAYRASGYKTGGTPAPGAFAVYGATSTNSYGHVAVVEKVWYDTASNKITGWYVSERNNSVDGQLKRTCFGNCPTTPIFPGFTERPKKDINPPNLLGFVYLQDEDSRKFAVDSAAFPPMQLKVERTSVGKINLSWASSGNTSGVSGYVIYREGVEIASSTGLNWVDTTVASNGSVCYQVATKLFDPNNSAGILSTRTAQACSEATPPNVALASPVLSGTCQSGQAALTWANIPAIDSITVTRNANPIKVLVGNATSYSAYAPANSSFTVQLRRGIDFAESNPLVLSCATSEPQTATITSSSQGTAELGERQIESNSRLPWVATYKQSGVDLIVRGRNINNNAVIWEQTINSAAYASAAADNNGLALLTYDLVGDGVVLQTTSVNANSDIARYTTKNTQVSGSGPTFTIDTAKPENQLAQPWKIARSSDRSLHAIYTTDSASDGTAPIWIFDTSDGAPRLVKTIRLTGAYVMGLAIHSSDVFVFGSDGVARRYPALGTASIKASIKLKNPIFEWDTFTCADEICVTKANSTGMFEVVDFAAGNSRYLSVGAVSIGKFKVAGGLLFASTSTSQNCKIGVYRLSDGVSLAAPQPIDCMNGTLPLPIDAMTLYDEWTSRATVSVWTPTSSNAIGNPIPPKTFVFKMDGLR